MDVQDLVVGLIAAGVIILVAFPVHEFAHAWTAYRLGDSTARYQGRLTLDPRSHFDPIGGVVLLVSALFFRFPIGWARPTPVNPYNLRYGRRGEVLVAAAGPLSNLVLAAAVAIPVRLIWGDGALLGTIVDSLPLALLYNVAWYFVLINVVLFIFNLLPIPPLDGWRVLTGLVDARLGYSLRQIEPYGLLLLFGVVLLGGDYLLRAVTAVLDLFVAGARQVALPL
ncbi:MAG TPA: site-2 protease family protein [Candidatus Limnocylindria bacterium]|nr:site-2 protease family protein [Candidatus Limnocylindria bacterium]